jgi:hypothetical protein
MPWLATLDGSAADRGHKGSLLCGLPGTSKLSDKHANSPLWEVAKR